MTTKKLILLLKSTLKCLKLILMKLLIMNLHLTLVN
ncbi:Uncharacterised protein [Streptococcus pneumoniae]|nr:Uncharacterised protein [Streptococcus pneumoniae]